MAATSNCPKCTQPVTIPDGLEPGAVVRCPTCEAEYPLREALVGVKEQEEAASEAMSFLKSLEYGEPESADSAPPELVPVAAVSEDGPPVEAEDDVLDVVLEEDDPPQAAEPQQQEEEESELILDEAGDGDEVDLVVEEAGEDAVAEEPSVEVAEQAQAEAEAEELQEELQEEPTLQEEEEVVLQEEPGEWQADSEEAPHEAVEGAAESTGVVVEPPAVVDEAEGEPAAVDPDPLVRGPQGDAEFRLSELIVASTGLALGARTASVIAAHGLLRPLSEDEAAAAAKESPALDVWGKVEAAPQLDLGMEGAVAAADHAGFAIRDEEAGEERPARTMPARPRRKPKKEKSIVRTMVEVVLGGLLAVPLALYAAVGLKGDQANFLNAPLPGYPSTYGHCPKWWPEWLKIGAEKDEATAEEDTQPDPKAPGKSPKPGPHKANGKKPAATGPETGRQPNGETAKPKTKKPPAGKAKPKPNRMAGAVGPLIPVSFTSDQLGEVLAKANAAFGCKNCNSTGKVTKVVTEVQEIGGQKKEVKTKKTVDCEVCKGHPLREMNEAAYDEFCRMAQARTFVTGPADDAQLANRKRAVRDLAEKAGASEDEMARIGGMAAGRLADEGRIEPGVFLAGTVEKTGPLGAVHVTKIVLSSFGKAKTVTVLSPQSLPVAAKDKVLVLGSIVDEPRQNLTGYEGPESVVIWAGECVKVR